MEHLERSGRRGMGLRGSDWTGHCGRERQDWIGAVWNVTEGSGNVRQEGIGSPKDCRSKDRKVQARSGRSGWVRRT